MNLEEIEKRLRDAANGPWIHGDKGLYYKNVTDSGYYWQRLSDLPANDELLAHMHEDMNFLIAEVKRLQSVCQEEHERFLLALSDCQNKDFEIDKLQAENERFREYVVKTGCSYTQTEDGIECDYEYPWLCDHCPVLEHNKAIDTEMEVGNDNHN